MQWSLIKDILLVLFGGGLLIEVARVLSKRGEDKNVIITHGKEIGKLKKDYDLIREKLGNLEQSTSIRLTAIEVQLKNIEVSLTDVSKDVKLILKSNIYKEG
jgi:hypothetical protein